MPNIKQTIIINQINQEVKEYFSYKNINQDYSQKAKRNKKSKQTSETMQDQNYKRKIEKLRLLLLTNFCTNDYFITLNYKNIDDSKNALENINEFITELRKTYKKNNMELKYIFITETEGHRLHHHIIFNHDQLINKEDIKKIWEKGHVYFSYYKGSGDDAERLANYMLKEFRNLNKKENKIHKQSYIRSKNLISPLILKEVIKSSLHDKPICPPDCKEKQVREFIRSDGHKSWHCKYEKIKLF